MSIANACNHNDPKDSPYNSTTVGCFVQKNPEDSLYSSYSISGDISFVGDRLMLSDFNIKVVAKKGIDPIFNFTVEIWARDQELVDRRPLNILPTNKLNPSRQSLRDGDRILRIPVNLVDGSYKLSFPPVIFQGPDGNPTLPSLPSSFILVERGIFYNNSNLVEFLVVISDGTSTPGVTRMQIIAFQKNGGFRNGSQPTSTSTAAPKGSSTGTTTNDGLTGISQSGAAGNVLCACMATIAFAFCLA